MVRRKVNRLFVILAGFGVGPNQGILTANDLKLGAIFQRSKDTARIVSHDQWVKIQFVNRDVEIVFKPQAKCIAVYVFGFENPFFALPLPQLRVICEG